MLDVRRAFFAPVGGVEVQSETVWHPRRTSIACRIAFAFNKLDRMGADFYGTVEQMKDKFGIVLGHLHDSH